MTRESHRVPRGRRSRLWRLLGVGFVLVLVLGLGAGWSAAEARSALLAARQEVADGRAAVIDADLVQAHRHFAAAEESFARASGHLRSPPLRLVAALPIAGPNLEVSTGLADAGEMVAAAARLLTAAVTDLPQGLATLQPANGAMPLAAIDHLAEPAARANELVQQAADRVARTPDDDLVAEVARARREFTDQIEPATETVEVAAALAGALPEFFGAQEPKRYLLLAQNPAELRGTGGFTGAYAIMTLDRGELQVGRFQSIYQLPDVDVATVDPPNPAYARRYYRFNEDDGFVNLNMTRDFPSAAVTMERLYAASVGEPLHGVVAVDPAALSSLLAVTGPVTIPRIGGVDAASVVRVVANEAYGEFEDGDTRKQVMGDVAGATLEKLFADGGTNPRQTLEALAEAASGGHLLVHSTDAQVQSALETAGVAGRLLDPPGDYLAVVVNNAAASKLDFYTERTVEYEAQLRPGGAVNATASVTLANRAPRDGLPKHVTGPNVPALERGENRSLLSLYCATSCELDGFTRSAGDLGLSTDVELGHQVFTTLMTVPSGESERVELTWSAQDVWQSEDGRATYRLTYQGQPTIRPTRLELGLSLPDGMVVYDASPELEVRDGAVTWAGEASPTAAVFEITFGPPIEEDEGPWEAVWDFLRRPLLTLGLGGTCCLPGVAVLTRSVVY